MATFALVHGSQHGAWCWQRLVPELRRLGHDAICPQLPCDQDAGVAAYAETVERALAGVSDVVLVGHSLGSLTIPVVARHVPSRRMIFLCSVPTGPGPAIAADLADMVTPRFLAARRHVDEQGREALHPVDAAAVWYHDCSPADAAWAVSRLRPQHRRPLTEASPLDRWPDVEASVVLGRDERCVNLEWAVPAATARLEGRPPVLLDGGHSPFLARPAELAGLLVAEATR